MNKNGNRFQLNFVIFIFYKQKGILNVAHKKTYKSCFASFVLNQCTGRPYPMKFTTTICKITWARMKSANPRSGEMPINWDLFSGFTCKRRHTETKQKRIISKCIIIKSHLILPMEKTFILITSKHKATDGRNEARQKRIERKCTDQTAIHELCDTGQYDVQQVGVDNLQLL